MLASNVAHLFKGEAVSFSAAKPPANPKRQIPSALNPRSPRTSISNRDTKLLEMPVSQRKQTMRPPSNRDKSRHFHDAFSSPTHQSRKKRDELESHPNIDF
jgi:hypothetical protein